eukprot:gene1224-4727_t
MPEWRQNLVLQAPPTGPPPLGRSNLYTILPKREGVFHAVFHDMVGGWHKPEFNNTQVGAHAFSADGGRSWVDTGVAFNLTVDYTLVSK